MLFSDSNYEQEARERLKKQIKPITNPTPASLANEIGSEFEKDLRTLTM